LCVSHRKRTILRHWNPFLGDSMPRPCEICCHSRRLDAERRCASGEAVLGVAKHLGMNRDALRRHMRNHVAPTMRAEARTFHSIRSG
jgi:hypothetical protein